MAAVCATVYGIATDYISLPWTARHEASVQHSIDQKEPPFTARVRYEQDMPIDSIYLYDHTLSEAQKKTITTGFTHRQDPRAWQRADALLHGPDVHIVDESWRGRAKVYSGAENTVYVDIYSDRESQLSIVDMHARKVHCRPAAAKAVVYAVSEGGGPRDGVFFDLNKDSASPLVIDGDRPYFKDHTINLGKNTTPGALRIEAAIRDQDCQWVIDATYSDSKGTYKSVIKDGKKPFFTPAVPDHPQQELVANADGTVHDCETEENVYCPRLSAP
ncbi:hypothetical protein Sm713_11560 [Streptomyces sp. TS71-3]|nr:hypothetical protein Sm713_11560 [Streptomyces sp. TS71-3]